METVITSPRERGTTLIEIALAAAILTFALVGVASAFGSNASAVGEARGLTKATQFLEEIFDSVVAQSFDDVDSLNGNVLFDRLPSSQARYRIRVTVSQMSVDLKQVRLVLLDNRTGNQITKLVTYRSRR